MIIVPQDGREKDELLEKLDREGTDYNVIHIYDRSVIILKKSNTDYGGHEIKRLYSRKFREKTVVGVSGLNIGESLVIAAGPCS
ncbi:MAG: 3-deoxy-7-phosphoheptulonate synthase, partial [Thermoplasmata archaeon]